MPARVLPPWPKNRAAPSRSSEHTTRTAQRRASPEQRTSASSERSISRIGARSEGDGQSLLFLLLIHNEDVRGLVFGFAASGTIARFGRTCREARAVVQADRSWIPAGVTIVNGELDSNVCGECLHAAEWNLLEHVTVGGAMRRVPNERLRRLCNGCLRDMRGFRCMLTEAGVQRECMAAGKKHMLGRIRKSIPRYTLTTTKQWRNKYLGWQFKRAVLRALE